MRWCFAFVQVKPLLELIYRKMRKNKKGKERLSRMSLCLGEIIDGLHADFIFTNEGKKYGSFVEISMDGNLIALYSLQGAKRNFWPIMERLNRAQSSLGKQSTKKIYDKK